MTNNNHGTAYYVTRSLVRFLFALVVTVGVFIGVPIAVELVWPAILFAAVLWTIVSWMYFHEKKKNATIAAS